MIRVLFDEQGDSHHDIFFKVDAPIGFTQVVDLYFVGDFLAPLLKDYATKKEIMIEFIKYIKNRILQAGEKEVFIPIDLSDQYVGGLLVTKKTKESVKVKYGTTQKIYGFEIGINHVDQIMSDEELDFDIEREWVMPISEIEKGLDWSSVRIQNVA
jgi:hypothetical protein